MSDQVRLKLSQGQLRPGQVRSSQVRYVHVKIRSCQLRSGKVKIMARTRKDLPDKVLAG